MTPRRALYLYLAVLPAPTFVHDPRLMALGLVATFLLSGAQRGILLKRSLLALLAFNLAVSLGVALIGLWRGHIDVDWLLMANLRALWMVYLGFCYVARGDLLQALAGWPTATFIATLAIGQIRSFERMLQDFRLAFTSRTPGRARLRDRRRQVGAQALALIDKAEAQSAEVALAMRSRGVFDA